MKQIRVVITGSQSQLAQSLQVSKAGECFEQFYLNRTELDVTQRDQWQRVLEELKPQVVINTAAYTNVEEAEEHEAKAHLVNAKGAGFGAELSASIGARFMQISTDYVFDGSNHRAYDESDHASPLNTYGASKLSGEKAVLALNPEAWVVRVSWLYSPFGRNFMKTMRSLFESGQQVKVVNDQVASPSCALSFADHLWDFIRLDPPKGIYHYSEEGEASWFDFANAIHQITGSTSDLQAVSSDVFPTKAKRPCYSKLSNQKISSIFTHSLPHWKETLERCLQYE